MDEGIEGRRGWFNHKVENIETVGVLLSNSGEITRSGDQGTGVAAGVDFTAFRGETFYRRLLCSSGIW